MMLEWPRCLAGKPKEPGFGDNLESTRPPGPHYVTGVKVHAVHHCGSTESLTKTSTKTHQQDDKLQQPTTVTLLMSVDEPQLIQS